MAVVNQPPILASSFAANGDKNTIPATNSGTEGLASLSLGFPSITSQPVSQGGIPPQREDFNGIFNLITNFLMFLQNGSIFAYSSSLDYQPPAIVYGNNALYRCVATNGANTSAGVQPLSNTTYWKPLIPVGAITISGNVITVTNETGTQIQYTIDTINNPPTQSDSSNKIVTSAWVKAYAPSKTGVGASGTWNITANKAISDKNGLEIDTNYLKNTGGIIAGNYYTTSNDSIVRIKTDGDNTSAGIGIAVGQGVVSIIDYNEGAVSRYPLQYSADNKYVTTITPSTSDNSTRIATTNFVHNYAPSKTGSGATGTWGINISGNASTATKATQDSQGQQINTTYVKSVTGSNATLTITKGNGSTSKVTVNNVANATKATQDSAGQQINTTYVKGVTGSNATLTVTKGNGTTSSITVNNVSRAEYSDRVGANAGYTNDTKGSALKGGLSQSAIYDNNFPFLYGNLISVRNSGANQIALEWTGTTGAVGRVAVRCARDSGIDTWSAWRYLAYTESPAFSGTPKAPTPGTTDNGTRIATTGFVHSLLGQRGNTTASKTSNGWWKDGNTGILRQWGYIDQGYYTSKSHNFPISFPNKCFTVLAICAGNVGTGATKNAISAYILNKSQFQLSTGEFATVYWEAIGY